MMGRFSRAMPSNRRLSDPGPDPSLGFPARGAEQEPCWGSGQKWRELSGVGLAGPGRPPGKGPLSGRAPALPEDPLAFCVVTTGLRSAFFPI